MVLAAKAYDFQLMFTSLVEKKLLLMEQDEDIQEEVRSKAVKEQLEIERHIYSAIQKKQAREARQQSADEWADSELTVGASGVAAEEETMAVDQENAETFGDGKDGNEDSYCEK